MTALFLLALIFTFLIGILLFVLLPFIAIIECSISDRDKSSKIVWLIIIFISWFLGASFYSLFFTKSKKLKIFAISTYIPILFWTCFIAYQFNTNETFKQELIQKIYSRKNKGKLVNFKNYRGLSDTGKASDIDFEEQIELIKGTTELYKKNYSGALDIANAVLKKNSKNSEALQLRSQIFRETNKIDQANIDLKMIVAIENQILAETPDDLKSLSRRASAYRDLEQFDKALSDLNRIKALNPNDEMIDLRIKTLSFFKNPRVPK